MTAPESQCRSRASRPLSAEHGDSPYPPPRHIKLRVLMAVLLVAAALAAIGVKAYRRFDRDSRAITQCATVAHLLTEAVKSSAAGQAHSEIVDRFCERVDPDGKLVIKNAAGELVDVWGNALLLRVFEEDEEWLTVEVRGGGPDGRLHTADDILMRLPAARTLDVDGNGPGLNGAPPPEEPAAHTGPMQSKEERLPPDRGNDEPEAWR